MPTITIIEPWFFKFFKEIASLGNYQLSHLCFGNGSEYVSIEKKHDFSNGNCRGLFSIKSDLSKLNHSTKLFWLCKNEVVQNPNPKPKGWWKSFGYTSEVNKLSVLANIHVKDEKSAEIWVYGEQIFSELKAFFSSLRSADGKEIKMELRQINEVHTEIYF